MKASKIGSRMPLIASTKDPKRTINSTGAVSMSATPKGYADFVNKIGEKLYNPVDSLGNEPNYMVNPQST